MFSSMEYWSLTPEEKNRGNGQNYSPSVHSPDEGEIHLGTAWRIATTREGSGIALINQTPQTQDEPEASESCS